MTGSPEPLNATIVKDGAGRQDAVDLGNGIFMSRDVSNLYRVLTDEGDVLINTGIGFSAEENVRRLSAVSDKPIRKIIFTQGHDDHIGGWPSFNAPGVETIAQANFAHVRGYFRDSGLGPTLARRSRALWSRDIKKPVLDRIEPEISRIFHDSYSFSLGGRQFDLLAVKGETLDSLVVWMPQDRIVFTGNLTGPLFGHVPNLYTLRGDKIRSVQFYIDSLQRVIDLEPETLVTGHGNPIRGAAEIKAQLSQIRDASRYLMDRTFEGMNAGKSLWDLMAEIRLPPDLAIGQGHGKVSWIVRAIWEEHLGWFRYESSTELYNVPPQAVMSDLIALAGGAGPALSLARAHLSAGRPLHALHIAEAIGTVPDALQVRRDANQAILDRVGRENFSEVRWLEAQIANLDAQLGGSTQ
jgi:alkyl sulfatase BDS1-like metallo-beta-lactamase superfamily hydrolase